MTSNNRENPTSQPDDEALEDIDKTIAMNDDATRIAEESGIGDVENLEPQLDAENRQPDNLDIHRGELAEDFVDESEEETQNIRNAKTVADDHKSVPQNVTATADEQALHTADATPETESFEKDEPLHGEAEYTVSGRGEGTIWPFTESDHPNKQTKKVEGASDNNAPFDPADEGAERPFDGAAAEPAAEPVAASNTSADNGSASDQDVEPLSIATVSKSDGAKSNGKKHEPGRIRLAYRRYKQTAFYRLWERRIKFSYAFYALTALVLCFFTDMFQIWSTDAAANYDPHAQTGIITQIWRSEMNYLAGRPFILNFIALAMIYLVCVTVINRFWIGTAVFTTIASVFAIANKIKISLRNEPIIPSDLGFISGGAGDNIVSFIPPDAHAMIAVSIKRIIAFIVLCIVLQFVDKRRAFIYCSWRHPIRNVKNIIGTVSRVLAAVLSVCLLVSYATNLSTPGSWARNLADEYDYSPALWDTVTDARQSGSLTTFLSLTKVKAMDEPDGYSQKAMQALATKYQQAADAINEQRSQTLTDNTVIFVLSESFADPTRVPGVSFTSDPMPYIRSLSDSDQASTGLMVSPSYGGGTANIEFQQLTGLSMANYNDTLLSPYQQLVPNRDSFFTFNQMWNEACGTNECSIAYHPYYKNLYLRGVNYKKFGFANLRTLDAVEDPLTDQATNEKSTLVTDEQSYQDVLDGIKSNTSEKTRNQFIELLTIQNHMPYNNWYDDNQFMGEGDTSTGLTDGEKPNVETFTKGANITDEATQHFLNELDSIDRPITVVFYGDHLPGIYSSASQDPQNNLLLHETDYFIWSNQASMEHTQRLSRTNAGITSSNFFMAQATEQMESKVSPYLALLTELHKEVPAMTRFADADGDWSASNSMTIVDADGHTIHQSDLSTKAKELLKDYKMVQYDMSTGKNYLENMNFTTLNYRK